MALALFKRRHNVPPQTGQRFTQTFTHNFGRKVRIADAAINGFKLEFTNADHHVHIAEVDIDAKIVGNNVVEYTIEMLLRDRSGNIDDPYSGYIQVLIIASVD